MGTVIIPIQINQPPPRREITESGIKYREVRPGDDITMREVGTGLLIASVVGGLWIAGIIWSVNESDGHWKVILSIIWPLLLFSAYAIIFG